MSIHVIDAYHVGRPGIIAATALETNDGVALFDTGPESTYDRVRRGLEDLGISIEEVRHVFVSHIHFDHAGAAWRFANSSSRAMIYVHEKGAPHLIDPTKLVQSATRIFGADMERLWGTIAPVPAAQVRIVQDGETIRVPPYEISAHATTGHASHHQVYHWDDNVFGGDVAGVRIGKGPVIPPFVPPELQVEQWLDSIAKIRRLGAHNLYLPHFGRVEGEVDEHLDQLEERVRRWSIWYRDQLRAGAREEELVAAFAALEHADLREGGADEAEVSAYEAADPSYMAVPAAIRYWTKFHPEAIAQPN